MRSAAAQEAAASYEAISLETPVVPGADESATMVDLMGGEDPGYDLVARRDVVAGAWKTLPEIVRIASGVGLVVVNALLAQREHSRPPLRRALLRRS